MSSDYGMQTIRLDVPVTGPAMLYAMVDTRTGRITGMTDDAGRIIGTAAGTPDKPETEQTGPRTWQEIAHEAATMPDYPEPGPAVPVPVLEALAERLGENRAAADKSSRTRPSGTAMNRHRRRAASQG